MEGLYKGFEIIKNHFHTSNQQRHKIRIYPTSKSIDISGKDFRDVPWNVSTGVSCHAYLIFGDV
jgi:hypothetical protein